MGVHVCSSLFVLLQEEKDSDSSKETLDDLFPDDHDEQAPGSESSSSSLGTTHAVLKMYQYTFTFYFIDIINCAGFVYRMTNEWTILPKQQHIFVSILQSG